MAINNNDQDQDKKDPNKKDTITILEADIDYINGQIITIDIKYTPNNLTDDQEDSDILYISANNIEIYQCNLTATCTNPLPKGPYDIVNNQIIPIMFQNVYHQLYTFIIKLDSSYSSLFYIKDNVTTFQLDSLATKEILIGYKANNNNNQSPLAKLIILCQQTNTQFIYYLKGTN